MGSTPDHTAVFLLWVTFFLLYLFQKFATLGSFMRYIFFFLPPPFPLYTKHFIYCVTYSASLQHYPLLFFLSVMVSSCLFSILLFFSFLFIFDKYVFLQLELPQSGPKSVFLAESGEPAEHHGLKCDVMLFLLLDINTSATILRTVNFVWASRRP